jgi:hypothetical protein
MVPLLDPRESRHDEYASLTKTLFDLVSQCIEYGNHLLLR